MFSIIAKTGVFTFLLTVLEVSCEPVANISASLAQQLCIRHDKFQETSKIQPPLKIPPGNDEPICGSYLWTKCATASCLSSLVSPLPFFVHKSCEKIIPEKKRRKKGKRIPLLPSFGIQEKQNESCQCLNSSVQGLPNPMIVSSGRKYPSLVTIERGDRCQSKLCSGLILNENWVIVTQAGCFYHYEPEFNNSDDFVIVAGKRRMYDKEKTEQRRSVAEYIPHPGYKAGEFKYYKDNIGLVRLSAPLDFNEHVQPIDLKAVEALAPTFPISKLKLVGWLLATPMTMTMTKTKTNEAALHSNLIESSLDYVPTYKCYDKKMEEDGAWPNTLICAGGCILHGDDKNRPLRNVLFAQAKFKLQSKSIPVPVGLGPMKHKFGAPQHGVFVNLVAYIPWMNETIHGQRHDKGHDKGQSEYDYHNEYDGQDDEGHTTQSPEHEQEVRTIEGENAPPHKYKSIVNLEVKRSYACHLTACVGTILNQHWFLTAAHCVSDWEKTKVKTRVIAGDRDTWKRERGEQVVSMSKVIIHENWNASKYTNNIALVKVTPPFRLNNRVKEAILPDPTFDTLGPFTAVGWALTDGQMYPQILEQIVIPFVSTEECASQFIDEEHQPEGNGQICAGNSTYGICKINSGSGGFPLFHIDEFGNQVIVGLGSYGGNICEGDAKAFIDPFSLDAPKFIKDQSTVFTKVTSYIDWIRKNAEIPEPIVETSTSTSTTGATSTSTTSSTSTSTNPTESSTTLQNKFTYK